MFRKLASVIAITAIVCTLAGPSAFAQNPNDPPLKVDIGNVQPETAASREVARNEQLKHGMLKLVADAKAGKVKASPKSPIQPGTRNSLSKGKKIAIGVGIAVIVVAVIVFIHEKNHLFDDFRLGN
jgi:hypothetical protein